MPSVIVFDICEACHNAVESSILAADKVCLDCAAILEQSTGVRYGLDGKPVPTDDCPGCGEVVELSELAGDGLCPDCIEDLEDYDAWI